MQDWCRPVNLQRRLGPAVGLAPLVGAPDFGKRFAIPADLEQKRADAVVGAGAENAVAGDHRVRGIHRLIHARAKPATEQNRTVLGIHPNQPLPCEAEQHPFAVHGGQRWRGVAGQFFKTVPAHKRFSGPADGRFTLPRFLADTFPDRFAGVLVERDHCGVRLAADHHDQQITLEHRRGTDAKERLGDLEFLRRLSLPNRLASFHVETVQDTLGAEGEAVLLRE